MAKGVKKGWKKLSRDWREAHKGHNVITADHSGRVGYLCIDCKQGASIAIDDKKLKEVLS